MRASHQETGSLAGKWHLGQQPQFLPTARGFDQFLGLPFSVDDGTAFVSPCPPPPGSDGQIEQLDWGHADVVEVAARSALGPSLPLPLIRQHAAANESIILEQPTDLRLLTSRLTAAAINFTIATPNDQPFFIYFAFGHVHTATPNVDPDSNPYAGKQWASCSSYGRTRRGLFGDGLAEVDDAVGQVIDTLNSKGIAQNTLSLFVSDNGPSIRWGLAAGSTGIFTGAAARHADGTRYTNTAKG